MDSALTSRSRTAVFREAEPPPMCLFSISDWTMLADA